MGALHEGHGSLVSRSASENDVTMVSIFVNPRQFGPREDFAKYPRTLDADLALCAAHGAQAVFAPGVDEMYPSGFETRVSVGNLSKVLCGATREGHFDGVCTVVSLLLHLVGPRRAYFGLKDYQQLAIIRRMSEDLAYPVEIVGHPTVREPDGLAMSSRNRYLSPQGREQARVVPRALAAAAASYLEGQRAARDLREVAARVFAEAGVNIQYLELRDARSLGVVDGAIVEDAVLAVACFIGEGETSTRLIDNIVLSRMQPFRGLLEELTRKAG